MGRKQIYGESTVVLSIRVPKSKFDEIHARFEKILIDEYAMNADDIITTKKEKKEKKGEK